MNVTEARDFYRNHFTQFEKDLSINQAWTRSLRHDAISRFTELGFPGLRHEEWKYTNVQPIVEVPFELAEKRRNGAAKDILSRLGLGNLIENRLVFVNGHYASGLSSIRTTEDVQAGHLSSMLSENPGRVEPYLARFASYREQPFVALNTAWMQDGAYVYVSPGHSLSEPIHLVFVTTSQGEATVCYPRNLIVLGENSQATIVETYLGGDNEVYWTNTVTEVVVGQNATVDHYKVQSESSTAYHLATLQVHQNRSSQFSSLSICLGGALARNDINSVLDGEGSECSLNGLYLADGQQHVDNHTRVDHVKPHCSSRELYKGILNDKAKGVFNGKIYVHTDAQGTDAKQTNKNLLLSEDATINTKPQLEIYNDNVKCTHGSTVGQLDQNGLFYLRSRGIHLSDARRLMTYAFGSELVGQVKIESLRGWLEENLYERF
ncbi:MAG: Fe-S cluster assembly protein SufD [Deltaproteobacteria bacterium]|nr:Fe-S cluster assembly protein SufD [Deltaproteobacteria bacterium]